MSYRALARKKPGIIVHGVALKPGKPICLGAADRKPVVILLPYAADFRWLRRRADTPWYPTAKLLRQPAYGDWDSVIADLAGELRRFAPAAPFQPASTTGLNRPRAHMTAIATAS